MLQLNDVLMFANGTREIPSGRWWGPASEYIITRGRERLAGDGLRSGMVIGFSVGLFFGLVLVALSRFLDVTF